MGSKGPSERDQFILVAARNGIDAWDAAELMQLSAAHGRIQVLDCNENCSCQHEPVKDADPPRWELTRKCRRHVREDNIQKRIEELCAAVPAKWRVRSKSLRSTVYKVFKRKGDAQRWVDRQLALPSSERSGTMSSEDVYLEKQGVVPDFGGDPRGYTVKLLLPDGSYNTWGGFECGWGVPQ